MLVAELVAVVAWTVSAVLLGGLIGFLLGRASSDIADWPEAEHLTEGKDTESADGE